MTPASLPPPGLPGIDPTWSRIVVTNDTAGDQHDWHVLGTGPSAAEGAKGTVLCVHGNPTWSYTFRSVVSALSPTWRVIAPDQLGMGFSERSDKTHRLADRIDQLGQLTEALQISGPVIVVAHDWGGPISLGWAERHSDDVAGIVLLNTAVSQPVDGSAPPLITAARSGGLLRTVTQRTSGFLEGTLRLAHPALPREVADAYRAPYREAARRKGIADFVADIPLEGDHPSRATLKDVADRLIELGDVPTLLLWGPRDPVFLDRYLRDLQRRLPQAQTHRFEGAGHLLIEDAPVAEVVAQFADDIAAGRSRSLKTHVTLLPATSAQRQPLWSALEERREDSSAAVVEMGRRNPDRTVTWAQLARTVADLSSGMTGIGVRAEDRVALLVPPSADLTAVLYATWRAGAVPVIADAGLGLAGMRRALRGANVQHVIGTARGLSAAKAMGLKGTYISVGGFAPAVRRALGVDYTAVELTKIGRQVAPPPLPPVTAEAAVLFTSGATGPAKGVVYRHGQLEAQRDLVRETFHVTASDRLVAAFAPFALFGPALGVTSAVPNMDVTQPGTLTARALADAIAAVDATLVFAAPAALRNIVRTASSLDAAQRERCARVRLLLSAGAPVGRETLRAAAQLLGNCEAHTPYGMTEALPVCDVTLSELEEHGRGNGVLVGRPVRGVQVSISPLDALGSAVGALTDEPDITGEVVVRGPHVKDHYDQLWATQRASARDHGWHRTGDVGHLDTNGNLWIEGRLQHVITTPAGVVTPVAPEQRIERLDAVELACVVGVGPPGQQVVVAVVEAPLQVPGVATIELSGALRHAAGIEFAAVLVVDELPVDIRHNSKIDRLRVAEWADEVLAGRGSAKP
ncbi:MAG TPA: alpha/beta fold hydrolase [Actinomycetes bacterium]|nr:alpha/beta fold hydrolase [Actinomycetes bacterium]